jgi:hypothetical protein
MSEVPITDANVSDTCESHRLRHVLRWLALTFLWALFGLLMVWTVAALYFDARVSWLRPPLAAIYEVGMPGLRVYFVSRRARTAPPVMPALSPSLEAMISTPFMVPGMA